MLLHVSNLPDPLVWVFIALLWFVLKGESSSAWQLLSLLTSVACFAVSQKFLSLKQLVGTCQVLHLQECVLSPLSFLSHHCSEFICHPRRGDTQRHPRFALLSARGAALVQHGGAATRSLTRRSWLVLVQEPGVGVRPCFSAAARGARGKSCFLLDLITNKQLWCLGR